MRLAITDAKARLTDLVRRAESGEEVVLTRHGDRTPIRTFPKTHQWEALGELTGAPSLLVPADPPLLSCVANHMIPSLTPLHLR